MKSAFSFLLYIILVIFSQVAFAQQLNIDYFISNALKNDAGIKQNVNQQQIYGLQAQLINAQNKKPQVNFTSDYTFAPFFADNGKPISITPNPAADAFGYDAALTNGGLYATQLNVAIPLLNRKTISTLQDQNTNLAAVNLSTKKQLEHDLRKNVTDLYIQVYQAQQQEEYLQQVIQQVSEHKATVEALVKRGLLMQSDYLLLEIEQNGRETDLSTARIAEVNAYGALKNAAAISDTGFNKLQEPVIAIQASPATFYFREKFKLDSLTISLQQTAFNTKYLPALTFAGSGGMMASDFTNIPHNVGLEASLHLNIPIYDGRQRKINDSQNKITQQGIAYARDNFTIQQKNYLQNIQKQIGLFNQNMVLIKKLIQKQDLLLQLDKEKLQNGQLSIIEYIKSISDYVAAKQNLTAAKVQVLLLANQYNYYNW
ncbi:outer membrane protein TolC [Mucilaginibacter gracilis]|uniref:Outer membrane protein TolC n=1 Tax=Mucilaginibacter gracilis TaxID=423350 RepID=A0A495J467_9SPHI|nr:TolC family protein [Mucilaginibacter gracilis]RKR83776.1 outer membrane protein TolC [Mucilaginibacter gracilis]